MPDKNSVVTRKTLLRGKESWTGFPLRRNVSRIPEALNELILQEHDRERANRKKHYFTLGERIQELFFTELSYGHEADDEWHFKRVLGYGGFGVAALYEQYSERGELQDQLCLKSEIASESLAVNKHCISLSTEAWNHAQLMERHDCDSNLLLHGFKYHVADNSVATGQLWAPRPEAGFPDHKEQFFREWRTYLEFGSYDTINSLLLRYKAWGYHLPEAFIWWMFYWLLESCRSIEAQSEHTFSDGASNILPPDSFILHNDMSHLNFFMQRPDPDEDYHGLPLDYYPMPKMADLGLSQLARLASPNNRVRNINCGLETFQSPERRIKQNYDTAFYPFGPDARRPPEPLPMLPSKFEYWQGRSEREHPIGPHSNLWGAAYVVFILMTLGDEYVWDKVVQAEIDEHEIHQQIRMQGFDRRRSSGQYQLFDDVPTSLPQVEEHGIADNYNHRIGLTGMMGELARLDDEFDNNQDLIADKIRVCFSDLEWNQTPRGPCDFGINPMVGKLVYPEQSNPTYSFWTEFYRVCHTNGTRDEDAPWLIPPAPASAASTLVKGAKPQLDADWVLYFAADKQADYHHGRPLPAGGRAQNLQKVWQRQTEREQEVIRLREEQAQILQQIHHGKAQFAWMQQQRGVAELEMFQSRQVLRDESDTIAHWDEQMRQCLQHLEELRFAWELNAETQRMYAMSKPAIVFRTRAEQPQD